MVNYIQTNQDTLTEKCCIMNEDKWEEIYNVVSQKETIFNMDMIDYIHKLLSFTIKILKI